MELHKRDNMGFQLAPSLIIFFVIIGAGFLICIGFAIFRFYDGDADADAWTKRSPAQDQYMREVRERTWSRLPQYGGQHPHQGPSRNNYAHAPMTPRFVVLLLCMLSTG